MQKILLTSEKYITSLAQLDLSNSKSKICSKGTHSIEEIIQTKIRNGKNFDLNITELDKLLRNMYWLPKIHKTLVGSRLILASYYCSINPLSDTISKIFQMIFNTVFIKKVSFFHAATNSGLYKIPFQLPLC